MIGARHDPELTLKKARTLEGWPRRWAETFDISSKARVAVAE
jgi:hypothetical protein